MPRIDPDDPRLENPAQMVADAERDLQALGERWLAESDAHGQEGGDQQQQG